MESPFTLENSDTEVLLETPETPTDKMVIFLPGVSAGAFSERFRPFAEACLGAGISVARVQAWKDVHELEQKTIAELHADIDSLVPLLQARGYRTVYGVGKSFGGGLFLTYPGQTISAKVLWAPAIGVIESGSNINNYLERSLSSVPHLLDVTIDRVFLEKHKEPVLVVHGTADATIPFSNSEQIVSMLPNAALVPIEGADHSLERENITVRSTVDFLIQQ